MRSLTAVVVVAGLILAACSSSDTPVSGAEFRADFHADLLDEIADAGLPPDLESLAIASLNMCLETTAPEARDTIDEFTGCFAESLCASDLVAPVWEGDTETCVAEARASFDFGG